MLGNRNFIFIDGIDKIGEFQLHYGGEFQYPKSSCLTPVFKCEINNGNNYILLPGYLSINNEFYSCPISTNHVQLNNILYYRIGNQQYVESVLQIFSFNYKSFRNIVIKQYSNYLGSGVVNPMNLNKIVNTLNLYIANLNDIEMIDENLLQNDFNLKILDSEYILSTINKLEFIFFSNDQVRVGKDNAYWNEIEVSCLPKNKYILQIFEDIINKSNIVNRITLIKDTFHLIYNHDYAWSPTNGRLQIKSDNIKALEIKDILKYNILKSFDFIQERNERLKIY